jgi:hypothetical protein
MTAHQTTLLREGHDAVLFAGDVRTCTANCRLDACIRTEHVFASLTGEAICDAATASSRTSHLSSASAQVYRRDEVDASHYFCFHQMDAVRVFSWAVPPRPAHAGAPLPDAPPRALKPLPSRAGARSVFARGGVSAGDGKP